MFKMEVDNPDYHDTDQANVPQTHNSQDSDQPETNLSSSQAADILEDANKTYQ